MDIKINIFLLIANRKLFSNNIIRKRTHFKNEFFFIKISICNIHIRNPVRSKASVGVIHFCFDNILLHANKWHKKETLSPRLMVKVLLAITDWLRATWPFS
jgi:hypothetical protein